jgi:hypothetical protein
MSMSLIMLDLSLGACRLIPAKTFSSARIFSYSAFCRLGAAPGAMRKALRRKPYALAQNPAATGLSASPPGAAFRKVFGWQSGFKYQIRPET